MPGTGEKWNVLCHRAIAPDQHVRGYAQTADFREIGMLIAAYAVGKQPIYPGSTEIPRRQTDTMDHN
jgi:hypothetical protein